MSELKHNKIFDLKNVDDLPEDLSLSIHNKRLSDETIKILKLFDIKKELSIDEILVGLFRKYNITKKRNWVSAIVFNLARRGNLKKVKNKRAVYKKVS